MRKGKVLRFILCLLFTTVAFTQGVLEYQKHLEEAAQLGLDKILGPGQSIIYVHLLYEEEKWEVNYTKVPDVEGLVEESRVKRQPTVVPGIPSLRFLSDGGGEFSSPLNYEIVQKSPQISGREVTFIHRKKEKIKKLNDAKNFIKSFLALDEAKGDKLIDLAVPFTVLEKASLSKQRVTSKRKVNILTIILIMAGVIVTGIVIAVLFKVFWKREKKSGESASESAQVVQAEKTDAEKKAEAEEQRKIDEEDKIQDVNKDILGNGVRFFNFINEENIYKLKFLLQVKIALRQATPRTVAVVMACLPFKLAASIMREYPVKIQAEIANNLLVLQHFPEKDLVNLEEEIKRNINFLFGGKHRLKQILEKITGEEKKKLLEIFKDQHRSIFDDLNSLVVLFEDILELDEKTIGRIFGDVDTEVIATSLVNIENAQQRKVMDTLPKGVQAMVEQWLNLKSNTASRFDVDQARQKVITFAQHLEKEGFINLSHD